MVTVRNVWILSRLKRRLATQLLGLSARGEPIAEQEEILKKLKHVTEVLEITEAIKTRDRIHAGVIMLVVATFVGLAISLRISNAVAVLSVRTTAMELNIFNSSTLNNIRLKSATLETNGVFENGKGKGKSIDTNHIIKAAKLILNDLVFSGPSQIRLEVANACLKIFLQTGEINASISAYGQGVLSSVSEDISTTTEEFRGLTVNPFIRKLRVVKNGYISFCPEEREFVLPGVASQIVIGQRKLLSTGNDIDILVPSISAGFISVAGDRRQLTDSDIITLRTPAKSENDFTAGKTFIIMSGPTLSVDFSGRVIAAEMGNHPLALNLLPTVARYLQLNQTLVSVYGLFAGLWGIVWTTKKFWET